MFMNNMFIDYEIVMELLGVKKTKAYDIIAKLNKELEEKGFLTQRGRVVATYFYERYGVDYKQLNLVA